MEIKTEADPRAQHGVWGASGEGWWVSNGFSHSTHTLLSFICPSSSSPSPSHKMSATARRRPLFTHSLHPGSFCTFAPFQSSSWEVFCLNHLNHKAMAISEVRGDRCLETFRRHSAVSFYFRYFYSSFCKEYIKSGWNSEQQRLVHCISSRFKFDVRYLKISKEEESILSLVVK